MPIGGHQAGEDDRKQSHRDEHFGKGEAGLVSRVYSHFWASLLVVRNGHFGCCAYVAGGILGSDEEYGIL